MFVNVSDLRERRGYFFGIVGSLSEPHLRELSQERTRLGSIRPSSMCECRTLVNYTRDDVTMY